MTGVWLAHVLGPWAKEVSPLLLLLLLNVWRPIGPAAHQHLCKSHTATARTGVSCMDSVHCNAMYRTSHHAGAQNERGELL